MLSVLVQRQDGAGIDWRMGKLRLCIFGIFFLFWHMTYFSFIPTSICRVDVNSISSFCLDKFVRRLARYRVYVCSTLSLNATKYRAWVQYFVCCKFEFDVKMELVSTGGWLSHPPVDTSSILTSNIILLMFWHFTFNKKNKKKNSFYLIYFILQDRLTNDVIPIFLLV